jgi:hypothetical protein
MARTVDWMKGEERAKGGVGTGFRNVPDAITFLVDVCWVQGAS